MKPVSILFCFSLFSKFQSAFEGKGVGILKQWQTTILSCFYYTCIMYILYDFYSKYYNKIHKGMGPFRLLVRARFEHIRAWFSNLVAPHNSTFIEPFRRIEKSNLAKKFKKIIFKYSINLFLLTFKQIMYASIQSEKFIYILGTYRGWV